MASMSGGGGSPLWIGEVVKSDSVRNAYDVGELKDSIWAVALAVSALGAMALLVEWIGPGPGGAGGMTALDAALSGGGGSPMMASPLRFAAAGAPLLSAAAGAAAWKRRNLAFDRAVPLAGMGMIALSAACAVWIAVGAGLSGIGPGPAVAAACGAGLLGATYVNGIGSSPKKGAFNLLIPKKKEVWPNSTIFQFR